MLQYVNQQIITRSFYANRRKPHPVGIHKKLSVLPQFHISNYLAFRPVGHSISQLWEARNDTKLYR